MYVELLLNESGKICREHHGIIMSKEDNDEELLIKILFNAV